MGRNWCVKFTFFSCIPLKSFAQTGSIHFSLIGGRILLKDVHYHSSNQTIKVVKGQVQWRYWIRRPTSEEEIGTRSGEDRMSRCSFLCHPFDAETTDRPPTRSLHCRIQISLQGFEWFLYNRTAAYDNIISQMEGNNLSRPVSGVTGSRQRSSRAGMLLFLYLRKFTVFIDTRSIRFAILSPFHA